MLIRVLPGRGRLLRPAGASVLRLRRSNRLAADARAVVLFGADRGVGIDLVTGQAITAVSSPRHLVTEDGVALNNAAGYGSLAHDASLDITGDITVAIRARALSADANFVDKVGGGSGATNTPFYLTGSLSGLYFVRSNSGYVAWQSNTAGLRTDRVQALSVVSQNINTAPTAYFDGVASAMTIRFTNGGTGAPTGNSNPVLFGNGSANYLNMAVLGARLWSESEQNQFLYDWAALVEDAPLYHFLGAVPTTHALTATSIATAPPVVGTPAVGQVHALVAIGIATGAPIVGSPAVGQIHNLFAVDVATGAPVVGTPVLNASASVQRTLRLPARDRSHVLAARDRAVILPARNRTITLGPERT